MEENSSKLSFFVEFEFPRIHLNALQIDLGPQVNTRSPDLRLHTFTFKIVFSSKDGEAAKHFPAYALCNSFHYSAGGFSLTTSIQKLAQL